MARTKRLVTINEKIADAKTRIAKDKARYDRSCKELEDLYAKRDAMRKDELWKAVVKSERTFEEIIAFIEDPKSNA